MDAPQAKRIVTIPATWYSLKKENRDMAATIHHLKRNEENNMYCEVFQEERKPSSCKYCSVMCNQRPIDYTITTTDTKEITWIDNLMRQSELLGQSVGTIIGEEINRAVGDKNKIIIKASRLAESILMDWGRDEQIALAKEVAENTFKKMMEE